MRQNIDKLTNWPHFQVERHYEERGQFSGYHHLQSNSNITTALLRGGQVGKGQERTWPNDSQTVWRVKHWEDGQKNSREHRILALLDTKRFAVHKEYFIGIGTDGSID